ncbi:MAG: AFG1/ZapE family ATPase [Bacteroidota bacterium]
MSALAPPPRFDEARFETYRPQNDAQAAALAGAQQFAERVRERYDGPAFLRWLKRDASLRSGLYLVGPVGTGKTHMLVSIYRTLHPAVPCAFLHSSALFRATEPPEAYAQRLADAHRVLLIDEIELDDPANEVRLINVLKTLGRLGVTVAATSNAEPEKFVSAAFGRDRLERFISEEFRRSYHVVFVPGEDFRRGLAKPGKAYVGPTDAAEAAMRLDFERDDRTKLWLHRDDLLRRTVDTERAALTADLTGHDALYLADLRVGSTDDALRLLRVVDDLYTHPSPPVLHFTAEALPEQWFSADGARGVEQAIAEKFERTVSRLHAMCDVQRVGATRKGGAEERKSGRV